MISHLPPANKSFSNRKDSLTNPAVARLAGPPGKSNPVDAVIGAVVRIGPCIPRSATLAEKRLRFRSNPAATNRFTAAIVFNPAVNIKLVV